MTHTSRFTRTAIQSLVLATGGLFLCGAGQAAMTAKETPKETFAQVKAEAKMHYETELTKCKQLSGNAEDICKSEASLHRVTAISTAEARMKGTPKAAYEARKDIADAQYDLAKEKCDDKAGNDKDVCKKEAQAAHVSAKADADVKLKTRQAIDDATEDKLDARQSAAKEKCDALAGDAKDVCLAKVKADFKS